MAFDFDIDQNCIVMCFDFRENHVGNSNELAVVDLKIHEMGLKNLIALHGDVREVEFDWKILL